MFETRLVESLSDPDLRPYLTLRRSDEHRRSGIFVAEGDKVVRRLLESSFSVLSLLATPEWILEFEPLLHGKPGNIQVFVAEKKLLEQLTGYKFFQGVLAVGQLPPLPDLAQLLETTPAPRLFVAMDELGNAENVGVIARNCGALGAHGLIAGETSCSPFLRRVVRSSMGAVFKLPVVESHSLVESIRLLRQSGVTVIAAHPRPGAVPIFHVDLRQSCCFVLGSEGKGISPAILAECDVAAAIPMGSDIDSLNVANASAVLLYEAIRQRQQPA